MALLSPLYANNPNSGIISLAPRSALGVVAPDVGTTRRRAQDRSTVGRRRPGGGQVRVLGELAGPAEPTSRPASCAAARLASAGRSGARSSRGRPAADAMVLGRSALPADGGLPMLACASTGLLPSGGVAAGPRKWCGCVTRVIPPSSGETPPSRDGGVSLSGGRLPLGLVPLAAGYRPAYIENRRDRAPVARVIWRGLVAGLL